MQTPHSHWRIPGAYPNTGLFNNFCRNPDGEDFPWCYTTDKNKKWDYCDISICSDVTKNLGEYE